MTKQKRRVWSLARVKKVAEEMATDTCAEMKRVHGFNPSWLWHDENTLRIVDEDGSLLTEVDARYLQ